MKTIVVTGATSGIGQAFAIHAASSGYKVIACGRNQAVLDDMSRHDNIRGLAFDVTDEQQTIAALADVSADIYVLNAGTCEYVDVDAFEPAMFQRVFAPNFFGVVNSVAGLLPNLRAGNQVVIVDSMARFLPFTRSQAYGASKAALHYFAKSLEVDLLDKGVSVQTVSPGFVKTPLTDKNDFDMPMIITSEQAAESMLNTVIKGKSSIYFPTVFGLILRFFNILPAAIKRQLAYKMRLKSLAALKERNSK